MAQPNFQFDKTFDTTLWNAVGKVSYQVNQKNKLTGYYQWGQKDPAEPPAVRDLHVCVAGTDLDPEFRQLGLQG